MVIRVFKCIVCTSSTEIEEDQPISEIIYPECVCGNKMNQVFGSVALQFKGDGWARKDNK